MAESFNLLRRVKSLDTAPETDGYSGVAIFAGQDEAGNNIEYFSGDRSGKVLEITNEWGSQAQADAIYRKIRGFRYQPYKAAGTTVDPSVEIGDAVTIADTYGGVFLRATDYRDTTSDLEAPSNEEIEHEFQIQSPTNRQYERFTRSVRSSLTITATKIAAEVEAREEADKAIRATLSVQADAIKARVEKTVGNKTSDFWWDLQANSWNVGSKNKIIFSVQEAKSGLPPGKSAGLTSRKIICLTTVKPGAAQTPGVVTSVQVESSLAKTSRWTCPETWKPPPQRLVLFMSATGKHLEHTTVASLAVEEAYLVFLEAFLV